jgi:hippurate hydrolase
LLAAFRQHFSGERLKQIGPTSASEDFGAFGAACHVPSVFWFVGVTDPEVYARAIAAGEVHKLPSNHSPFFAPVLHPSLEAGVEAMVVGALAWLAKDA